MTWTTKIPVKEGWYWLRARNVRQRVVEVYKSWGVLHVNGEALKTFAGEWSSHPLTPPSEGEAR